MEPYNFIIKFFKNLKPNLIIQSPSRINLINPLDAVEADYWMPSVAVNGITNPLSVFCYIKEVNDESRLKIYELKDYPEIKLQLLDRETIKKDKKFIQSKFSGKNKLIYASLYRAFKTNSHFWEKFLEHNLEIGLLSTIPIKSGLGGSASIIIAILYGLTIYFNLENNLEIINKKNIPINRDIIAEMATFVEDKDLNITAGYGDRYCICRGGLSFSSYYGKLKHKKISEEPLAIFDRLDETYDIEEIPIIICYSGITHHSGNVHSKLREVYLKKDKFLLQKYKEIAKISWKSRFALMSHNWELLGEYCRLNTRLMNEIMKYCGFKFGIGLANNILINLIEDHKDVYSVKLTGAGGGGSVFALVHPEKIDKIIALWKNRFIEFKSGQLKLEHEFHNMDQNIINEMNPQFFKIKIDKNGVKKLY